MGKTFASTDTSVKICPYCGSELVPAEYYSAVKGNSNVVDSKTDWASGKTTKTISTNYSDVQKCQGVYCMACLYKKKALMLNLFRGMVLIGFLGVLCFGGMALLKNEVLLFLPGLPFLAALIIGWKSIGNGEGVITSNPYARITKEQIHAHATKRNEGFLLTNSYNFIQSVPKDQIPEGRVLLSLGTFK